MPLRVEMPKVAWAPVRLPTSPSRMVFASRGGAPTGRRLGSLSALRSLPEGAGWVFFSQAAANKANAASSIGAKRRMRGHLLGRATAKAPVFYGDAKEGSSSQQPRQDACPGFFHPESQGPSPLEGPPSRRGPPLPPPGGCPPASPVSTFREDEHSQEADMYQRGDIKEGMTVRSIDGHKLGKVYAVGDMEFHIEKGLFFPKDYSVRYAEISDLRNGEIILAHGKDSLRSFSDEVPYGSDTIAQREGIGTGRVHAPRGPDHAGPGGPGDRPVQHGGRPGQPHPHRGGPGRPYTGSAEDRLGGQGVGIPSPRAGGAARHARHRLRGDGDDDAPARRGGLGPQPRDDGRGARPSSTTSSTGTATCGTTRRDDTEGTRKLDLSGETDPKNKRGI